MTVTYLPLQLDRVQCAAIVSGLDDLEAAVRKLHPDRLDNALRELAFACARRAARLGIDAYGVGNAIDPERIVTCHACGITASAESSVGIRPGESRAWCNDCWSIHQNAKRGSYPSVFRCASCGSQSAPHHSCDCGANVRPADAKISRIEAPPPRGSDPHDHADPASAALASVTREPLRGLSIPVVVHGLDDRRLLRDMLTTEISSILDVKAIGWASAIQHAVSIVTDGTFEFAGYMPDGAGVAVYVRPTQRRSL